MTKLRILLAAVLLALFAFGGASPAQATPAPAGEVKAQALSMVEFLECSNGDYHIEMTVRYDFTVEQNGQWTLDDVRGNWDTIPNFQLNALWLDLEWYPNTWFAVAHYGGTAATLNDVPSSYTIPNHGTYEVLGTGDGPAWRMSAWGVGSGNSTYFCNDYGLVAS